MASMPRERGKILPLEVAPDTRTPEQVILGICRERSIAVADLRSPRRSRWLASARREIVKTLHRLFPAMSQEDLVRFVGRKDHTTAWYLLHSEDAKPSPQGRSPRGSFNPGA